MMVMVMMRRQHHWGALYADDHAEAAPFGQPLYNGADDVEIFAELKLDGVTG